MCNYLQLQPLASGCDSASVSYAQKIEIVPLCYAPMHLMALIMLPRIVYYVRAMLEYVVTAYEISPVLFQHVILPFAHCS